MCLIGIRLAQTPSGDPELLLAANRDEFADRPSAPLHWWPQGILAGKDERAGGTWLGLTRSGRFAAITNVRDPAIANPAGPFASRGLLVNQYLQSDESPHEFAQDVLRALEEPAGFNLLLGQIDRHEIRCYWVGGRVRQLAQLSAGTHVLSNAELNTPWPKALRLKHALTHGGLESAHEVLTSVELAPDHELPETGVPFDLEKKLSAALIVGSQYHTRATTLISATPHSTQVREITWGPTGIAHAEVSQTFSLLG